MMEEPSSEVALIHVTAPAEFRESISSVTTLGNANAFATSACVEEAFQDANRGLSATSTLALSETD